MRSHWHWYWHTHRSHHFLSLTILLLASTIIFLSFVPAGDSASSLRVMSYNIAAGHGDLSKIAKVIREQNPDLIALQEVDVHWGKRSNYKDQVSYLGKALNMYSFFAEIYKLQSNHQDHPHRQFGLAILSKKPFETRQNHSLTRLSSQTETTGPQSMPGFPEVSIKVAGQDIRLFNTHLDYRPDPHIRRMHVEEMKAIMEPADTPTLLLGDLNARPESGELRPLFRLFEDAWSEKDMNIPGFTYPASRPDRRIDYILHTDHFEVKDIFVAETGASDHRPVVADLIIREKTRLDSQKRRRAAQSAIFLITPARSYLDIQITISNRQKIF